MVEAVVSDEGAVRRILVVDFIRFIFADGQAGVSVNFINLMELARIWLDGTAAWGIDWFLEALLDGMAWWYAIVDVLLSACLMEVWPFA